MKIAVAAVIVGLAFTGPVVAQDGATRCKALSDGITAAVKEMSYYSASDIGDNSAPRASVRAMQINSRHTEISNRLALMAASRCAPYSGPIGEGAYLLPAMSCLTASMARESDEAVKVACDRSTWGPREGAF